MRFVPLPLCLLLLAAAARADPEEPTVSHVGMVAPAILGITVRAGRVEYGEQSAYVPQPGDGVETRAPGETWGWVKRAGKVIGARVGPEGKLLHTVDRLVGAPLDTAWADLPASYRIVSPDDPAYAAEQSPTSVFRKSKPSDLARVAPWQFEAPVTHTLYLVLPQPLRPGRHYRVVFGDGRLPAQAFTHEPAVQRSEAVHVGQVGFRPDDPVKIGYVSCWMGSGGGVRYAEGTPFQVLEERSGRPAFEGRMAISRRADEAEDVYKRNYTLADVYALDFSALSAPGTYRLSVEGIGCSYPFEIAPDVWRKAFTVSARGFYHQRSGTALGPPHTDYRRPRCFHPKDGVKVVASTCSLMDSGNGLNARGTDKSNFGNLVAGKTEQVVPDAWGGYFDAGDWDRRIQHLDATRLLLELAELRPEYFASVPLNLPESGNGLPDIVNEARWNLDFYRRLQTPEGGVRGGIESAEHPQQGEASWQESLAVMAYAPDVWSSYLYAGCAARAAGWLRERRPALAEAYRESALKAISWAEDEYARTPEAGKLPHPVRDARNLAAVEIFRLTGEPRWHDLFLATTAFRDASQNLATWKSHDQADAAFVYLRLQRAGVDETVRAHCRAALLRMADACVATSQRTAFGWSKNDPWQPAAWGVLGVPQAVPLVRAHALTGRPEYLRAAVLACQTGAGANPANLCYTTGVGRNSIQHVLCVDARISRQSAPPGLTVYGPRDLLNQKDSWEMKNVAPYCFPPAAQWPATEAYFDVFWFPSICEFTIMQTLGPNAYVWGYLAAR